MIRDLTFVLTLVCSVTEGLLYWTRSSIEATWLFNVAVKRCLSEVVLETFLWSGQTGSLTWALILFNVEAYFVQMYVILCVKGLYDPVANNWPLVSIISWTFRVVPTPCVSRLSESFTVKKSPSLTEAIEKSKFKTRFSDLSNLTVPGSLRVLSFNAILTFWNSLDTSLPNISVSDTSSSGIKSISELKAIKFILLGWITDFNLIVGVRVSFPVLSLAIITWGFSGVISDSFDILEVCNSDFGFVISIRLDTEAFLPASVSKLLSVTIWFAENDSLPLSVKEAWVSRIFEASLTLVDFKALVEADSERLDRVLSEVDVLTDSLTLVDIDPDIDILIDSLTLIEADSDIDTLLESMMFFDTVPSW